LKKTRFAPTPSGFLHRGNQFNANFIWNWAKSEGAILRLRIDDIDQSRFRLAYLENVFSRLRDWGIQWQEGPLDATDFLQNHSQHLRLTRYSQALSAIREYTYACSCSRKETQQSEQLDGCPKRCREMALEWVPGQTALRAQLKQGNETWLRPDGEWESVEGAAFVLDPVVWTREGLPAYHWVSIIDDLDMGITDVWRGADLLVSTGIQRQLARLAGFHAFEQIRFGHHALITDEFGNKLSKSVLSQYQ
jgi:glutamyl-tRNA synthetase